MGNPSHRLRRLWCEFLFRPFCLLKWNLNWLRTDLHWHSNKEKDLCLLCGGIKSLYCNQIIKLIWKYIAWLARIDFPLMNYGALIHNGYLNSKLCSNNVRFTLKDSHFRQIKQSSYLNVFMRERERREMGEASVRCTDTDGYVFQREMCRKSWFRPVTGWEKHCAHKPQTVKPWRQPLWLLYLW